MDKNSKVGTQLTVREFRQVVEFNIENNIKRAILALGAPGIGKSEVLQQLTSDHNMGLVDMRLTYYSETDLKGIPFPDEKTRTTVWYPNKILPTIENNGPRGILLLDELNSAPKRVQTAAYQLVLDRKLCDYVVPEGWFIVACGNREEDDGVFVQLPSPLANRFEIHSLYPELEQWKADYAYPKGVHPSVIAYLNFTPSALHTQEPGQNSMKFASPRSWTAVSDILNSGGDVKNHITKVKIAGNVGDIQASSFFEFLRYQDSLVDADKVLEGKIKNPPEDKSLLYLTFSSIVAKMSYIKDSKILSKEDEFKLTNACNYMLAAKPDYMVVGFKDLTGLNPRLVRSFMAEELDNPKVYEFINKNSYLYED